MIVNIINFHSWIRLNQFEFCFKFTHISLNWKHNKTTPPPRHHQYSSKMVNTFVYNVIYMIIFNNTLTKTHSYVYCTIIEVKSLITKWMSGNHAILHPSLLSLYIMFINYIYQLCLSTMFINCVSLFIWHISIIIIILTL